MKQTLLQHTLFFFTLWGSCTVITAPSKAVTDELTAELQSIRKNLALNTIELFEQKDNAPHIPWEEALCRTIINEDKPCTALHILTNHIQKILYCTHNVDDDRSYKDKDGNIRIGSRINYTYSERAERILRLDSYINSFVSKAIAYVKEVETPANENSPTRAIVIHDYELKLASHSTEYDSSSNSTHTITPFRLRTLEARFLGAIYLFSNFLEAHAPLTISPHKSLDSEPPSKTRKRTHSAQPQEDNTAIADPKRLRTTSDAIKSTHDTRLTQSINPESQNQRGLLSILASCSYETNTLQRRSDIIAHQGLREHFLKSESQDIARTMMDQAEKLSMLNGMIFANTESEQHFLADIPSRLEAYKEEKREILYTPEINRPIPCMIAATQEICENVSDLEANHAKKYDQNVKRIKQWYEHYQQVLNMGLIYLKTIQPTDTDHIKERNALINRFGQDLNTDVISTLPPQNAHSTNIEKALDLQRISLANKTTRALTSILRIQKMCKNNHGNQSDTDDDDDD